MADDDDDDRDRLYPSSPPLGSDRDVGFRKRRSFVRKHAAPLITLLVVVVVLVGGVVAVAATWNAGTPSASEFSTVGIDAPSDSASSSGPVPAPGAPAPTTTPKHEKTGVGKASTKGTITSVSKGGWTMTGADGVVYTVVISSSTKFGKKAKSAQFVAGVAVEVIGLVINTTITATTVTLAVK